MTAKKNEIPPDRRVVLEAFEGGAIARYPWKTYRFLLDDGSTFDVQAVRDDSDLRGAVLEHTKATKIEGVATINRADVPDTSPDVDLKPKATRTIKRRAT